MKKYFLMIALAFTSLFMYTGEARAEDTVICTYKRTYWTGAEGTITIIYKMSGSDNSFMALYDEDYWADTEGNFLISNSVGGGAQYVHISNPAYEALTEEGRCPERAFLDDNKARMCIDDYYSEYDLGDPFKSGKGFCPGQMFDPDTGTITATFSADTRYILFRDEYIVLKSKVKEEIGKVSVDDISFDQCTTKESIANFVNNKIIEKLNKFIAGYPENVVLNIVNEESASSATSEREKLKETAQNICNNLTEEKEEAGEITKEEATEIKEEIKLVTTDDIGTNLKLSTSEYFNFDTNEKPICGIFGKKTWGYIKTAYSLIKIFIPALIVLLGMMDFLKVLFSGDEKDMKAAGAKFMKRLIAGIIFVLLPVLVEFLIYIVGFSEDCIQQLIK